jgi:hypothetical protein
VNEDPAHERLFCKLDHTSPMNRCIRLLVLGVLGATVAFGAPAEKLTYYVQLIRGNDEGQPPAPGAKAIGPKLSQSLHAVFRWKHYWEISRQEVTVAAGAKTKVVLSNERTVEIDLSQPKKRKVTAFSKNQPVCTTMQPVGEAMTIIGADRDTKSAWFVVVRRDKPSID